MVARTYNPTRLLERYREISASITEEQFFRRPGMSRVREMWCAAHFATAFNRYLAPCSVSIDDVDTQDDVDFDLIISGTLHSFQVAEVMEPGRRRADEYKDFVPGTVHLEDWSEGTAHGAQWIREAIEKKLAKNYSRTAQLSLLLYVNFPSYDLKYEAVREATRAVAPKFASTWLLNGNTLACLHPSPNLSSFEGWLMISESLVVDEP